MLRQHARNVQRHVSCTNDGDFFGLKWPRTRHVRMSVVPVDEVSGAIGLREVDSRNVEGSIANTPGGEKHHVMEPVKLLQGEVGAEVDVADEPRWCLRNHSQQGQQDVLSS